MDPWSRTLRYTDPEYGRLHFTQDVARDVLGIKALDEWQRDFLLAPESRIMVVAARQLGKSTMTSLRALHQALYHERSAVVLASPTLRQSQLLFKQVLDCYVALGRPVPADSENKLSLDLTNKSLIASLPGSERTVRGFSSVDLVVLDEAAACDDDLLPALSPMTLVSNGTIIQISSPRGKIGRFYETWAAASERGWRTFHVPAPSVPRITEEALRAQRADLTESEYEREVLAMFTEAEGALFKEEDLERMTDIPKDLDPELFKPLNYDWEGALLD
jgi:Terminase large subunit, T4likevirus-type, N-terminal